MKRIGEAPSSFREMAPALAGSAIVHGLVLGLIALNLSEQNPRLPETTGPMIELTVHPERQQTALPPEARQAPTPATPGIREIPPIPEPAGPPGGHEPAEETDLPSPITEIDPLPGALEAVRPDSRDLRAQARDLARQGRSSAPEDLPTMRRNRQAELPGAGPPATLPSRPGWLNHWVGPVTPSSQTEREGMGIVRSRVVHSSGQVYCGYTELPGMFEQFTVAVTTWFPCGRERPDEPDATDPWIRPFR